MENLYNFIFSYCSREKKATFWDFANAYKYAQKMFPDLGDLLLYKNIKSLLRSQAVEDEVYYLEINREDSNYSLGLSLFEKELFNPENKKTANISTVSVDENRVFISGSNECGVVSLVQSLFLDMNFDVQEDSREDDKNVVAAIEKGKLFLSQTPEADLIYESVKTIFLEPQLNYLGKIYKIRV